MMFNVFQVLGMQREKRPGKWLDELASININIREENVNMFHFSIYHILKNADCNNSNSNNKNNNSNNSNNIKNSNKERVMSNYNNSSNNNNRDLKNKQRKLSPNNNNNNNNNNSVQFVK